MKECDLIKSVSRVDQTMKTLTILSADLCVSLGRIVAKNCGSFLFFVRQICTAVHKYGTLNYKLTPALIAV